MEQKRPRGRGIEEIAHFFFSSNTSPDQNITSPDPPKGGVRSARIFALVSLVEALPTPLFTANLAIEMAYRQKKVLIADTACKAMNVFFALGMGRPFTPIEELLTREACEVIASGPVGIRIISFHLDPDRLPLVRSIHPSGLFRTLIREEQRNDIFLVNIYLPSKDFSRSPAYPGRDINQDPGLPDHNSLRIFSEALEILLLIPSDLQGLKLSYYFLKCLFQHHSQSRIGILLCHDHTAGDADAMFGLLAGAATKFLGSSLKFYGTLIPDRQLYLSLIQGKPLCRKPVRDENTTVFAEMARKISEEIVDATPRTNLPRISDRSLLLETLSTPSQTIVRDRSSTPLSIEENSFFDREQQS